MKISNEFIKNLYTEHLEEISFLFEQRQSLFTDLEITWLDIEDFENRLIPHLDAMDVGGEAALACAKTFLTEEAEEPCDIFAAAYSLSLPAAGDISPLFDALKEATKEQLPGYFQAFRYSQHPGIADKLFQLLDSNRPEVVCGALKLLTERHLIQPQQILPHLESQHPEITATAIEALGILKGKEFIKEIEPFATHDDPAVRKAALGALLHLGHLKSLDTMRQSSQSNSPDKPWLNFYLAMAGGKEDFRLLLPGNEESVQPETLKALGILGHVGAGEPLLHILQSDNKELHLPAAKALQLITGSDLTEMVTITEEIDMDEYDEGEEPEPPTGFEIEQVSTSFDKWSEWWTEHKNEFNPELRYRLGQPFTPGLCIEEIATEKSRFEDRGRAYLELVIHTEHDIPFKPDWFVARQKDAIEKWKSWWEQNRNSFKPGSWTFNMQEI